MEQALTKVLNEKSALQAENAALRAALTALVDHADMSKESGASCTRFNFDSPAMAQARAALAGKGGAIVKTRMTFADELRPIARCIAERIACQHFGAGAWIEEITGVGYFSIWLDGGDQKPKVVANVGTFNGVPVLRVRDGTGFSITPFLS